MGLDATSRRRVTGALFLLAALGMLIAGQTVLKSSLRDAAFLAYWLLCFVFTAIAIVVAYLDARAVQQRTRREARDLIEHTLGKIDTDAEKRPSNSASEDGV